MKKPSKKLKKAARPPKRKRATSRPFPYDQVAKMWALKRTIPEIALAIGRVGKGDDPYHSLRVALTKMHKGYTDESGNIVTLPHRVSPKTLKARHQSGQEGIGMIDEVGKVFRVKSEFCRRCLVCDSLFTREASREHSTKICFPAPPACPPIPYGVTAGAA